MLTVKLNDFRLLLRWLLVFHVLVYTSALLIILPLLSILYHWKTKSILKAGLDRVSENNWIITLMVMAITTSLLGWIYRQFVRYGSRELSRKGESDPMEPLYTAIRLPLASAFLVACVLLGYAATCYVSSLAFTPSPGTLLKGFLGERLTTLQIGAQVAEGLLSIVSHWWTYMTCGMCIFTARWLRRHHISAEINFKWEDFLENPLKGTTAIIGCISLVPATIVATLTVASKWSGGHAVGLFICQVLSAVPIVWAIGETIRYWISTQRLKLPETVI